MHKNKKGVLILTPFFSPNIGGVETHLDNLVSILDEQGYRIFVQTYSPLTTENTSWKKNELLGNNIQINRYRWFGKNLFHNLENHPFLGFLYLTPYLFFRSLLFMITNSKKIDVIHAQGLNAGAIGVILKVVFKKRLIISLHSIYTNIDDHGLIPFLIRMILNSAHVTLGVSKAVNRQFNQTAIKVSSLKKYRYWVDLKHFKPMNLKESRKKIGVDDRFTVLFVGRLIPIKGIKLLVEIARELDQIQFLFIGAGPLESFLNSASEQNTNIKFLGQVQNYNLPVYYNSADVFCIPSQYEEGLGRVVMESVSCGIPVVGSNRGGISEALNKTISILLEPTHDNLKNTIQMLHMDKQKLMALKMDCRNYATMNYSKQNLDLITRHYV
ncbi:MAG TPA: glycosyltransferase family 1 protein [Nitrospinaceae bacterium]|nr:glycosyltransferase family 1 protein [Nitrospinaceae bacterium]